MDNLETLLALAVKTPPYEVDPVDAAATKMAFRQAFVAEAVLRGIRPEVIADRLMISVGSVRQTMTLVRQEWLARAVAAVDVERARELAKLELIEAEAFEGWSRSMKERTKSRRKLVPRAHNADGTVNSFKEEEVSVETEKPYYGDPKWMELIMRCMDRRARLLGLDMADRLSMRDPVFEAKETVIIARAREYAERFGVDPDLAAALLGAGATSHARALGDGLQQPLDTNSPDGETSGIPGR